MKELITEGLSKDVYHFTYLDKLDSIIDSNTIYLSPADSKTDKSCQPEGYGFFLSLTTQASFEIGYAGKKNGVKSTTSENNDEYKGVNANTQREFSKLGIKPSYREIPINNGEQPSDYSFKVKSSNGKNDIYIKDKNQSQNRQAISTNSETEERIFSKTRKFENVYDFIKRIDICPRYSPLCVRICFDSEKLEMAFKTGRVDYLYQKYRNSMDPEQQKRKKELDEGRGRKPKLDGYKGLEKHKRLFKKSDWDILYSWLKPLLRHKKTGKVTDTETSDSWFDKIYIHVNKHTSNLGSLILNTERFKEKYDNKDEGVLSSDYLKKLIKLNGKEIDKENYPEVQDTKMLELLLFLYKKYGENNINVLINIFKGDKIKNEQGKTVDFYKYLCNLLKTPAFKEYFNKYKGQYENIRRRLNKRKALDTYGLKIADKILNMLSESENKISITETDIKYMVNEVIDRLKNKNPHK